MDREEIIQNLYVAYCKVYYKELTDPSTIIGLTHWLPHHPSLMSVDALADELFKLEERILVEI